MDANVNDIIYGDNLSHFTENDFLDLAIAALDQVSGKDIAKVVDTLQRLQSQRSIYSTLLEPEGHR